jgi:hypothetical protein
MPADAVQGIKATGRGSNARAETLLREALERSDL